MVEGIPEFGIAEPGVDYVLRPGGYAIIFGGDGRIVVVDVPMGLVLPGGGQTNDESPELAAIRETEEECGLQIVLGPRIGIADELVFAAEEQTHYRKRCTFFLADIIGTSQVSEPDHQMAWQSPQYALATLLHESQRWAVAEARQRTGRGR